MNSGQQNSDPSRVTEFFAVCGRSDVSVGQSRRFDVKGIQVAVFNVEGRFFALRDQCPHAGASLAAGYLEDDVVRCRIHHWGFCVRDGRYIDQDLPNFDAISLPVRVVDDRVEVAIGQK